MSMINASTAADPERRGIGIAGGPLRGQIRGQEVAFELQYHPELEESGVPECQHDAGPAVGEHAGGLAGQPAERVIEGQSGLTLTWSCQVRQPAVAASSVPGQVEGAFAGGVARQRSSNARQVHCIRSQ